MRRVMGLSVVVCATGFLLNLGSVLAGTAPLEIVRVGPEEVSDLNGDGLLDELRIPIELMVTEAGPYVVTAELRLVAAERSARRTRLSTSWELKLNAGTYTQAATFYGPTLYETGHDGAYEITVAVHRYDPMKRPSKPLAVRRYATRPYRQSQFSPERTFCIVDGVVVRDLSQCPSGLEAGNE